MNNYIVNWSNGISQENFLVVADSFGSCAEIVMSKKAEEGFISSIYNTTLSIDKNMGANVYYIGMGDGSEFFVTSSSWLETKNWVYGALGSNIDTIMYMGLQYIS
jgi:hypothetical protein